MKPVIAPYCGFQGSPPSTATPTPDWHAVRALFTSICGAAGDKFPGLDDVAALLILCYIAPERARGAARRHALLEGAPGTAKTELTKAVAESLECYAAGLTHPSGKMYARIQGTPDLLPSAFTGYEARTKKGLFRFRGGELLGPTSVYHVDELNRIPSRTLAVLLEAMAEGQVTLNSLLVPTSKRRRKLPWLFVVGTQNPGAFVGTNPLPEPLLDRFMIRVIMPYPERPLLAGLLHSLDATGGQPLNTHPWLIDFDALRQKVALIIGTSDPAKVAVMSLVPAAVQAPSPAPSPAPAWVPGPVPLRHNLTISEDIAAVLLASWPLGAASLIPGLQDQLPHQRRLRSLVDENLEYGLGVRAGQALRDLASAVAWSRNHGVIDPVPAVSRADVELVAPFVLPHRLRFKPGRCARPEDQMDFARALLQQAWAWRDSQ